MTWQIFTVWTASIGIVASAVWQLAQLRADIKHQNTCQGYLIKAISKLNVRVRNLTKELREHIGST